MAHTKKKASETKTKTPAKAKAKPKTKPPVKPSTASTAKSKPARKPARVPAAESLAAPSDEPSAEQFEPVAARELVKELRIYWPPVSNAEREALDAMSTPTRRAALGGQTKAVAVAADATRWAGSLDRQLRKYSVLRAHYHPRRFSYFLGRLEALIVELGVDLHGDSTQRAASRDAGETEALARKTRKKLLVAMRRLANRRPDYLSALADARGDETNPMGLATSITRLTALGTRWLGKELPAIAEMAGLSKPLIAEARAAAKALGQATIPVLKLGTPTAQDSPALNVAEGAVLEEMLRAREDVASAREEDPRIQAMVAGPGTRRVLVTHPRKKKAAKANGAEPAPADAAAKTAQPTTTPAAQPATTAPAAQPATQPTATPAAASAGEATTPPVEAASPPDAAPQATEASASP